MASLLELSMPDFETFIMDKGYSYPYVEVRRSNNNDGFICKWLILADRSHDGNSHLDDVFYPVPFQVFSFGVANSLMAHEHAIPMTPDMDEVMDFVSVLTDSAGCYWRRQIIDYFSDLCCDDSCIIIGPNRKQLFGHVISMKVCMLLDQYIKGNCDHTTSGKHWQEIYMKWDAWYHINYQDDKGFELIFSESRSFVKLAAKNQLQNIPDHDTNCP